MRASAASIVISTRNRREDALRAVESAVAQSYKPLEVIVYDDASDDGTADAITQRFPSVRVVRGATRVGYIALRNRGFQEAIGEFVFSLDDDAYFTDFETVAETVETFERRPNVAAIALPYSEPSCEDARRFMQFVAPEDRVRGYVGCAHAVRRSVVVGLGGYRELFVHQGEERDLCIRLLELGYEVIYGDSAPIIHLYSPNRDRPRVNYYGIRNTLLFTWFNVPQPYVIPRLAIDLIQLLRYRFSMAALPAKLWALSGGLCACLKYGKCRRPVSRKTYRLYRSLPVHGPCSEPRSEVFPKPRVTSVGV